MHIKRFVCGRARSNAYVAEGEGQAALLVDAGMSAARQMIAYIRTRGLQPAAVVLTHGHPDHIWTARELCEEYQVPCYIHGDDLSWFMDPMTGDHLALVRFGGRAVGRVRRIRPQRLKTMRDATRLELGPFDVEVLHTPGHSKGSVCLRLEDVCFAGDTVFRGSVGAVYVGGDRSALRGSIRSKLLPLLDDVSLLPGHGMPTTVGAERAGWERYLEGRR